MQNLNDSNHAPTQMSKWDHRFFHLCDTIAGWSEDRSRKVAAIIVGKDNEIRSTGYNGLPRGIIDQENRHQRDNSEKYFWFEHAERNAIYNAARSGTAIDGCRIYVSLFPCADCTRAIIQSGIRELLTFEAPEGEVYYRRSFEVSLEMLAEAGVVVKLFKRP